VKEPPPVFDPVVVNVGAPIATAPVAEATRQLYELVFTNPLLPPPMSVTSMVPGVNVKLPTTSRRLCPLVSLPPVEPGLAVPALENVRL